MLWYGLSGGLVLALYGVLATWQTANVGRVYAVYVGVFILPALVCAGKVDGFTPDRRELIGTTVLLIGAAMMINAPRG